MTRLIILLFFVSLVNCNCNKPSVNPNEECEEIETLVDMFFNPLFHTFPPTYSFPCINPNDPNELIFIFTENNGKSTFDLRKLNIESQVESTIYEGNIGQRPRWSKKNWILLSEIDFNIYKIKGNGDSLTQLTFDGNSFAPEWDVSGDKFISMLGFTNPIKYPIYTDSGDPIDTSFAGIIGGGTWQHPELTTYTNTYGLVVGNPGTGILDTIYRVENSNSASGGAEWIDNERIIWAHLDGIRITNITTNETSLIRETCNAKYYQLPTYSPQNNKVIFQVIERKKTNETGGVLFSYLARMNIDGTEEEIIKFLYH